MEESGQKQGRAWGKLIAAAAVGAAIAVVAVLLIQRDEGESAARPFQARIPPAEFLYLDGPRILNYLAQLEGGRSKEIHRISKEINSVSGGVEVTGLKGGASSQREDSAEITLTRTAASGLGLLLHDLRENTRHGVQMHPVVLRHQESLEGLEEGWLVRFVTNDLLSPGYIRPYVVVRQSATLAALFPRAIGSEADRERSELQKRRAESFARQVGPNPRITFAVAPPSPGADASLKLLLPMRYRFLTDERSLLEKGADRYTGGRLVVIGKVIRVFDGSGDECADRVCRDQPEYTDWATREIWDSPLEQASNFLIRKVSHSCRTHRRRVELAEHPALPRLAERRACFLVNLRRQTEVEAPGAVILPLAVYK